MPTFHAIAGDDDLLAPAMLSTLAALRTLPRLTTAARLPIIRPTADTALDDIIDRAHVGTITPGGVVCTTGVASVKTYRGPPRCVVHVGCARRVTNGVTRFEETK